MFLNKWVTVYTGVFDIQTEKGVSDAKKTKDVPAGHSQSCCSTR